MFIDMHVHSVSSDDSRATVDQYVKWASVLRRRGYRIDGFVLTEHRRFDSDKDYSMLADDNDLLILKGSELDTNCGHFLVYGVTEELARRIDFADVNTDATDLMRAAEGCGAIVVPAHPGRFGIGLYEFIEHETSLKALRIVEHLNGGDRAGERERAEELMGKYRFAGIGGSDAHLVSAIGSCMTRFDNPVSTENELLRELSAERFLAVHLEEARVSSHARS